MVRWGDTRPASPWLPGQRMAPFTSRELAVLHRALREAERAGRRDVTAKALLAQIDDELRRRRIDPYAVITDPGAPA